MEMSSCPTLYIQETKSLSIERGYESGQWFGRACLQNYRSNTFQHQTCGSDTPAASRLEEGGPRFSGLNNGNPQARPFLLFHFSQKILGF